MVYRLAILTSLLAASIGNSAYAEETKPTPTCTEAILADLPSEGIGFAIPSTTDIKPIPWMLAHPVVQADFAAPVIKHSYGTLPVHGLQVNFVVGDDGSLVCATPASAYHGEALTLDDARRAFLAGMSAWHFKPFLIDGQPARVQVNLTINEEELPPSHVDMPDGDPAQVTITQDEHPAFASYGPYHVELHGDGTAIYTSGDADDPLGPQTYHVDPKAVQNIVPKAQAADFWSLRDRYRQAGSYGSAFERLNITLGGVTKSLADDGPYPAGMPHGAGQLQFDVLAAANIEFWQIPTVATLDQLQTNGFDFTSDAAGMLLLQMTQHPSVKNDAITDLMGRGAPTNAQGRSAYMDEYQDLLQAALANGRSELAAQLIADGALLKDNKPDADEVQWALSDAVYSGDLKSVDLILPFHPAMTYPDPDSGDDISILLRLGDNIHAKAPIEVAQRLLSLGAKINATDSKGRTLLLKVADNTELANFLLDHGADINAADKTGRTVLAWTFDEDVALMLLSRSANPRKGESGKSLRFNITANHWVRVKAWLSAHGYADVLVAQPGDDD